MDKIINDIQTFNNELKNIYHPKHYKIFSLFNMDDWNSFYTTMNFLFPISTSIKASDDQSKSLELFINNEDKLNLLLSDNIKNIIYDNYGYYHNMPLSELFSVFENLKNDIEFYTDDKINKIIDFYQKFIFPTFQTPIPEYV